jgi:hypothetical protein
MKVLLSLWVCLWYACMSSNAQTTSTQPTTYDQQYFMALLGRLGSTTLNPISAPALRSQAIAAEYSAVATQFGFNQAELAAFQNAATEFGAILEQLRASERSITAGKSALSPDDRTAIAKLVATRDENLVRIVTRVMSSVRPETLARMRIPGQFAQNPPAKNGGKWK